jgi:uncharacterized protein (TIGR03067 family)
MAYAVVAVIALMVGAATSLDERPKAAPCMEAKEVEGIWTVTTFEAKGIVLPKHQYVGRRMSFGREKFTIESKDRREELGYRIDWSATPASIDITGSEREKRYPLKGIVRRDGETLWICVALPQWPLGRPTKFKSEIGNKTEMWTLKRTGP